MTSIRRVIRYSGLNFNEVLELPCDLFKLMVRDSLIEEYSQTEEGRSLLDEWRNYQQTEPNLHELKPLLTKFGKQTEVKIND